ncbi:MAG: molecular chaperone GrpE [Candidatus Paceibacteria bacterium]|jgi:molecular chaperone GrpE
MDMENNEEKIEEEILNGGIDIEFEETEFEGVSQKDKLKKLREELKVAKKQSQEYLTGWQTERASFANYKAEEERKRKDRLDSMRLNLVSDFFPVLDSFDMAFSNQEAWEKVDPAWRTGVEYIHSQFMTTLEQYNVTLIDQLNVVFDPMMHDPVERIPVETQEQHDTVVKVVQKGYQSGNVVLRPAKVNVGNYEN